MRKRMQNCLPFLSPLLPPFPHFPSALFLLFFFSLLKNSLVRFFSQNSHILVCYIRVARFALLMSKIISTFVCITYYYYDKACLVQFFCTFVYATEDQRVAHRPVRCISEYVYTLTNVLFNRRCVLIE